MKYAIEVKEKSSSWLFAETSRNSLSYSNTVDFNHHQAEGDANLLICQTVEDSASRLFEPML